MFLVNGFSDRLQATTPCQYSEQVLTLFNPWIMHSIICNGFGEGMAQPFPYQNHYRFCDLRSL